MTKGELEEIEKDYQRHACTAAGQRILKLVAYCRELEKRLKEKQADQLRGIALT